MSDSNPPERPMPKPGKERLDAALASRGLCDSREQGKRLILAGEILLNGHPACKPGHPVKPDDDITVKSRPRYVSRGGLKMEGALSAFGVDPTGMTCLDAGASTGGFTDCLLQHGAARVYAFDVGTNQLVWKIRSDPRVVAREQFNLRHLQPEQLPEPVDLAVLDLSFISLTLVLPAVMAVLHPDHGQLISLIKPQFELRREEVGAGGIVRDGALHIQAVERIRTFIQGCAGWHWRGLVPSPIKGTDGNVEFLAWVSRQKEQVKLPDLRPDPSAALPNTWKKSGIG
jgi:23S rRNA (cytidine1920-2'-O)/16S rRNA (cytidine1409-2'-O)-methyltransferase